MWHTYINFADVVLLTEIGDADGAVDNNVL
jgi:hypothetical protein